MNIEALRSFCLSLKGAKEGMPFDDKTLVFSVQGKMFCATSIDDYHSINVKCNPEKAILLREQYEDVMPGYHMNKKHWNSVSVNGEISIKLLEEWITHSYNLVVSSLPKKIQQEMEKEI